MKSNFVGKLEENKSFSDSVDSRLQKEQSMKNIRAPGSMSHFKDIPDMKDPYKRSQTSSNVLEFRAQKK